MTRIVHLLLASALLAGCSTAPAAGRTDADTIADGSEFTLGIGENARLADGSRVTYLRLDNDSRCRPDVRCVWAGDAQIALRWQPTSGRAQELTLYTPSPRGGGTARIGERNVFLVSLERGIAPKATLKVERAP